MDARGTHQLGDGLGEEVVVPTNGSSGGRRGAEVEVGQCLAVRERPQEQLLREFLLLRRRRRHRGGGKEEEEEEEEGPDRCINQRRGADGSLNFRIATAARGRGGSKKGRGVKGREGSRGRPEPEEGGGWDWTADWEWEKRESQAKPQPQPFCKADAPGFAAFFTFYLFSVCFLL